MPITVEEKLESRQSTTGQNASVDLIYIVRGSDDDIQIKSAVDTNSPSDHDGLEKQSIHIEPIGPQLWEATVRYGIPGGTNAPPPETGESSFSFDTGGGNQHITQSLQTVGSYAATGMPGTPDFQGAIGVADASGGIDGVDITVPVYQFSETHYIDDSVVTLAYRGTLFNLTGKTNDAPFKGLSAGEGLFLGASGTKRGSASGGTSGGGGAPGSMGDWEITFRFAASPNRTGMTIGGITGIDKKGWEYIWVRYADVEDTTALVIVKKPVAVYVEKVYEEGDFAALGIGT